MSKFCPECGRENKEKAKFCVGCGGKLSAEDITSLLDNRYEIVSTIKSGDMGFVYLARDVRLDSMVALKQLISASRTEEEEKQAQQRFRDEARLLSKLDHAGLPKILDFFNASDAASGRSASHLAMTYIEGHDLKSIIAEKGRGAFSVEEVLDYFRQILEILSYLHSQSPPVIYRELKPSHVMISGARVYLLDFGIARIFAPGKAATITGTPGYAAPEQYKGSADPRSDLYSLGALIHFLLTGDDPEDSNRPPFTFDRPGALNPDVPRHIDEIVMSMLDLVRDKRPASAGAVLQMLGTSSGTPQMAAPAPTASPSARHASPAPEGPPAKKSPSTSPIIPSGIILKVGPPPLPSKEESKGPPTAHKLFRAIKYDDVDAVKQYFEGGGPVDVVSYAGVTALHAAVEKGNPEIVQMLLDKGADAKARAKVGWTPIHVAAMTGDVATAKVLISRGADINTVNDEGKTPVHRAVHWKRREFIKYLVSLGADLNIADKEGHTPLLTAVIMGKDDITKILVANGANVNYIDKEGFTIVHHAAISDQIGSLKILLLSGANVNEKNNDGLTPLHIVAQKKYGIVADLLVDLGAEINATDNEGRTPLHCAALADFSMVAFLVKRGADINARDKKGNTPLQRATRSGKMENASLLKKIGASNR